MVYNFKKANFDGLREHLKYIPFDTSLMDHDININLLQWSDILFQVVDLYIPKIAIRNSQRPSWIDKEVIHLANKKQTAYRKFKRTNSDHHKCKHKELSRELKRLTRHKYKLYLASLGQQIADNPKRFWSFFREKTGKKSVPNIISDGVNSCTSSVDKSNMFNKYFFSVFSNKPEPKVKPVIKCLKNPSLSNITLTIDEVYNILNSLDTSKATGPDGLPARILKECSNELAPSLCRIFNMSLSTGVVPDSWKEANVVPIHKKGNTECVTNYRPISLLCILSKILERCIFDRVYPELIEHFHNLQHGFIKGRSTTTQMLHYVHVLNEILDHRGQIDVLYLDFSKAFDSVSHSLLIHKLQMFGFNGLLLKWFDSYLSCRKQRVIIDGEQSDWLPVLSGVPQGSILGPMLFLLYINDLPACVSKGSQVFLYADDSKCARQIKNISDCDQLQNDIDSLSKWSKKWEMDFNVSKCKLISITRKRKPIVYDYTLFGQKMEHVSEILDLGVNITNSVCFNFHIDKIIAKANKTLGMIRRVTDHAFGSSIRRDLYISLVRSQLEYCSQVWSPYTKRNVCRIESVQRRGTKFILNDYTSSYENRLIECKLLPLSYRRECLDLQFLFKAYMGETDCNILNFMKVNPRQLRGAAHGIFDFILPLSKTDAFKFSYFNRVAKLWNTLAYGTRACNTVSTFKTHLKKLYFCRLYESFNSNDICTWTSLCNCTRCRY